MERLFQILNPKNEIEPHSFQNYENDENYDEMLLN